MDASTAPLTSPSASVNQQPSPQQMFEIRTGNYRPPLYRMTPYLSMGLPPFTITAAEMMRRDPIVRLGMAIKIAPLLKPKFEITGRPDIVQFVGQQLKKIWVHAMPSILKGLIYGTSPAEQVWKIQGDMVVFRRLEPIYPSDVRILTQRGELYGLRVLMANSDGSGVAANADFQMQQGGGPETDPKNNPYSTNGGDTRLIGPKAFMYVHKREWRSWRGWSELEGSFETWLEKRDQNGAIQSRKLWFYKNAFDGGILFHPPGSYTDPNDPSHKIPYRDLARWAMESAKNGGVWAFESVFDPETKQRLWDLVKPGVNGGGEEVLEYIKNLDVEMLHGLEIPDDVVSMVNPSPGGHGGRSIPLVSFFISQNVTLQELTTEVVRQIVAPLCQVNFNSMDFEVQRAEINIDELMPSGPGQGPGQGQGDVSRGQNSQTGQDGQAGVLPPANVHGQPTQPGNTGGDSRNNFMRQLSQGLAEKSLMTHLNAEPASITVNDDAPVTLKIVI